MERFLQVLQEEFRAFLNRSEGSTPRRYAFAQAENLAKVAIGVRRSGKTYFLF